jgi:hypothetical protein
VIFGVSVATHQHHTPFLFFKKIIPSDKRTKLFALLFVASTRTREPQLPRVSSEFLLI